jgi:hypothetical protein
MPFYTFERENGEIFEENIKISEYDGYVEKHKLKRVWQKPASLISGYNAKPSEGFRDLLGQIKRASGRNNTINTFK